MYKGFETSIVIFVGVGPHFDVKYACLFPINKGYNQNFQ